MNVKTKDPCKGCPRVRGCLHFCDARKAYYIFRQSLINGYAKKIGCWREPAERTN